MFFGRPYWYTSLPNGLNISLTTYENLGYSSIHHSTVPPPYPFFLLEGQLPVPNFEKEGGEGGEGQKKMSAWEDLKNSCHQYLLGGFTMFLVRKDF